MQKKHFFNKTKTCLKIIEFTTDTIKTSMWTTLVYICSTDETFLMATVPTTLQ